MATTGLPEVEQRMLDKQPNWLVPPTRWRLRHWGHQPTRYRTPTPYPKDDRKRLDDEDPIPTNISEKMAFVENSMASHVKMVQPRRKHKHLQPHNPPSIQHPHGTFAIAWERSPRLNRFERVL